MARPEQFKHKHIRSALWPLLSPLLCSAYLHFTSTNLHRQEHLLSHEEQRSPSTNKQRLKDNLPS